MQIQSVTANAEFTNAQVVRALVQRAIGKFEPKPNSRFTDWGGKFHIDFYLSSVFPRAIICGIWVTTSKGLFHVGCAVLSKELSNDRN